MVEKVPISLKLLCNFIKCACNGFGERYYNQKMREYVIDYEKGGPVVQTDIDKYIRRRRIFNPGELIDEFAFLEYKYGSGSMLYSQMKSFESIIRNCRTDKLFLGYFVVWSETDDLENSKIKINGRPATFEKLTKLWVLDKNICKEFRDDNYIIYDSWRD